MGRVQRPSDRVCEVLNGTVTFEVGCLFDIDSKENDGVAGAQTRPPANMDECNSEMSRTAVFSCSASCSRKDGYLRLVAPVKQMRRFLASRRRRSSGRAGGKGVKVRSFLFGFGWDPFLLLD